MYDHCICDDGDYGALIYLEEWRRAGRSYRCVECREEIRRGDLHWHERCADPGEITACDGSVYIEVYDEDTLEDAMEMYPAMTEQELTWHTYRTCPSCKRVRDDLFKCGFSWGYMYEDIRDHYGEECV